jgi:hypothetical protein
LEAAYFWILYCILEAAYFWILYSILEAAYFWILYGILEAAYFWILYTILEAAYFWILYSILEAAYFWFLYNILEAAHLPNENKHSNSVLTPRKEAPWMMWLMVFEAVPSPHITVFPTSFLQPMSTNSKLFSTNEIYLLVICTNMCLNEMSG